MEDRQPRNRRQFTAEFKRDAVDLVRTIWRPIAEIARELGIYDSTLGNWVRQARIDRAEAEGLTTEERARLRQLETESTRLRMECDLLKRTVAFWVKEQSTREPLPLRRCPESRRVLGSRRLPGSRRDRVGLLRLDRQASLPAPAGRCQPGR
jgi:transposase